MQSINKGVFNRPSLQCLRLLQGGCTALFLCLFVFFVCFLEFFSILISFPGSFFLPNRGGLIPNNHSSRIHIYSDFLQMMVIMMMMISIINAHVIVVVASTEKQDRAIYAFT